MDMPSLFHFNPFFKRAQQEPPAGAVNLGDRFYKPGQRGNIWTVIRIFKPTSSSLTHVVLERSGDHPETYVISLVSLMNPHMFRRDRRDFDSANPRGRQRRWSDHIKTHRKPQALPAESSTEERQESHSTEDRRISE